LAAADPMATERRVLALFFAGKFSWETG